MSKFNPTRLSDAHDAMYLVRMPYSEVCMHMRIAGKLMWIRRTGANAVQVYTRKWREFSAPITTGEAGVFEDHLGAYCYGMPRGLFNRYRFFRERGMLPASDALACAKAEVWAYYEDIEFGWADSVDEDTGEPESTIVAYRDSMGRDGQSAQDVLLTLTVPRVYDNASQRVQEAEVARVLCEEQAKEVAA